ncbi:5718_t:CDS:2, partial [Dentiscutata heterogama]
MSEIIFLTSDFDFSQFIYSLHKDDAELYFNMLQTHLDKFMEEYWICLDDNLPQNTIDISQSSRSKEKCTYIGHLNEKIETMKACILGYYRGSAQPVFNDDRTYDFGGRQEIHQEQDNEVRGHEELERNNERTGTGTLSIFASPKLRFNLCDGKLPVIITKKMRFKAIVYELLWMLSGSTDSKKLSNQGVKIWDKNTTQEQLDNLGLGLKKRDCGPSYGFQFRYSGARYIDCKTNYQGQGVNQITK